MFPAAREGVDVNRPGFDQLSECGKRGPSVKPKKGDALLFWSLTPEAKPDSRSLHGKLHSACASFGLATDLIGVLLEKVIFVSEQVSWWMSGSGVWRVGTHSNRAV